MASLPAASPTLAPASTGLPQPYLLFLGDVREPAYAKTAFGLRDWARERCVGECVLADATVSTGLPQLSPLQASMAGARSLVIGVANPGGYIPDSWLPMLLEALDAGLDLIGGMHARLVDIEPLRTAAKQLGRQLIDVRQPPAAIPVANGRKRRGKRLLTIGTDCALGKKYTALALSREFHRRGLPTDFRATGQTGILIAGEGVPLDAVVADFAAGAAELLSPDAAANHWDVIEGQGSLSHPAYAGVSLSLLHGSQPDVIVLCHAPGRAHLLGYPQYPLPSVEESIELALHLGRRTNARIRCAGVSLNTYGFNDSDAGEMIERESARLGLPVADPMRGGKAFDHLVDACLH